MSDENFGVVQALALAAAAVQYTSHREFDMEGPPTQSVATRIVPDGYTLVAINTESAQVQPDRERGKVTLRRVGDFVDFLSLYKDRPGMFVFGSKAGFRAVINHHGTEPGWGDYIVEFEPEFTPWWTAWQGFSEKWIEQRDFAEFLEERMGEIAEPDGAFLLEAITTLQFKTNINFQSKIQTENLAVSLTYEEVLEEGHGPQGVVQLPRRLMLRMEPFRGAEPATIEARLRYDVSRDGKARFKIVMGEAMTAAYETALLEAERHVVDAIEKRVLRGTPAAVAIPDPVFEMSV